MTAKIRDRLFSAALAFKEGGPESAVWEQIDAALEAGGLRRVLSDDEFEELAMMGMTKDESLRLGEGAAARVLKHAKALAEATAKASGQPAGADDVLGLLRLNAEVERLRAGIREHRDARGDDRCWMDDLALYQLLPEGFKPPKLDSYIELENCKRFIACRQNPSTEYVSPQRRIEALIEVVKACASHSVDCDNALESGLECSCGIDAKLAAAGLPAL